MKKFRTIKTGITFFLDYDLTVETIRKRRRSTEPLTDKYCCMYLDGLDACDIWDYFESAIMYTVDLPSATEIVED
jgi:hypothetical protein